MTMYLLMTLYFLVPYWTKLEPQNFFSVHSLYCRIDAHLKIWGALFGEGTNPTGILAGSSKCPPGFGQNSIGSRYLTSLSTTLCLALSSSQHCLASVRRCGHNG